VFNCVHCVIFAAHLFEHTLIQICRQILAHVQRVARPSPAMQRKSLPLYKPGFLPVSAGVYKTAGFFRSSILDLNKGAMVRAQPVLLLILFVKIK